MRRLDYPCTLAIAVAAAIATAAAHAGARDLLIADGRIAHGQAWRALTGPLVHATWGHLVRDLALVLIAGCAYEAPLCRQRRWLFGAGLIVPGVCVLLAGEARWYCGLSGLSHALLAAALAFEAGRRRGAVRAVVIALGAVAAVKPIYEVVTGAPAFPMDLGGVHQTPIAHAIGAWIGVACGLATWRSSSPRCGSGWSRGPAPRHHDHHDSAHRSNARARGCDLGRPVATKARISPARSARSLC
ncbi:MAG TPA: rhomboid family intramembrane serine protease [Kofleriaceae bacterium]|nr:rhomboid family intramembrane serine protease [Kofleriaceae bacterium]